MTDDGSTALSRRGFLRAVAGGTAVAGAAGAASAQQGETVTVAVGPGGDFVFEPGTDDPLRIKPGTTVRWVWESDNHNIVVGSQPEGANWQGHEPLENEGFEYTHTFEVEGEYHYWCEPHKPNGMIADIVVAEDLSTPTPAAPVLPDSAKSIGVAAAAAMASTLALAYAFIKYGGGTPPENE